MNYYYDLPLELQNYIEDFLIVKPYDNELLNNEEEIEKNINHIKAFLIKYYIIKFQILILIE